MERNILYTARARRYMHLLTFTSLVNPDGCPFYVSAGTHKHINPSNTHFPKRHTHARLIIMHVEQMNSYLRPRKRKFRLGCGIYFPDEIRNVCKCNPIIAMAFDYIAREYTKHFHIRHLYSRIMIQSQFGWLPRLLRPKSVWYKERRFKRYAKMANMSGE